MSITTTCPGCKSIFRLLDELAGKSVRCQKCEQLFVVPLSVVGTGLPMPMPEPQPVPDDLPSVHEEQAPVVEAPPMVEVLEPIEATLAEPAKVEVVAPAMPEMVAPVPVAPVRPPSPIWTVATLGLFLMGMLTTGAFASIWVVAHLEPPPRVVLVPPLKELAGKDVVEFRDRKDFGFRKKFKGMNRERLVPTPVFFDIQGQISKQERTELAPDWVDAGQLGNFGPFRAFRVTLELGKTYNFYVSARDFTPKVRIFEGEFLHEHKDGVQKRLFYQYTPKHTGEFIIHVSNIEWNVGDFFFGAAIERKGEPKKADVKNEPKVVLHEALRMHDPRNVEHPQFGPYLDYAILLEANTEYEFEIKDADFRPILRITDGFADVESYAGENVKGLTQKFRPRETREYNVRVTGNQFGVGLYTFSVTRVAPPAKPPQRILAPLNRDGLYEDTRSLTDSDPPEPSVRGRGAYKEYSVSLAKGQTYRIELSSKKFAPVLTLFNAEGRSTERTDAQTASITLTPNLNGVYRIHAASAAAGMRGEYTLRIVQLP